MGVLRSLFGTPTMNVSRESRPLPAAHPSRYAGVYRCRFRINGCRAYYRIDESGRMVDAMTVRPGMSEAQVVADLAVAHWGNEAKRTALRLVRSTSDAGACGSSRHPSPDPRLRLVRPRPAAQLDAPRPA